MRISIRGAFASLGKGLGPIMVMGLFSTAMAADLGVPVVPGGWTSVASHDDEVTRLARFAVLEQGRKSGSELKLLAVKHARHQVVAGSQYSMNLMVQSEGKRHLVIAVVWLKPDGGMELTRWHWV
jgi:hypothetical protein